MSSSGTSRRGICLVDFRNLRRDTMRRARSGKLAVTICRSQLTSFIGRSQEIAEIRRLFSSTRLLTLTGAGGCGKTRLALQVAADLLEQFRGWRMGCGSGASFGTGPGPSVGRLRAEGSGRTESLAGRSDCPTTSGLGNSCWCWTTVNT